MNGCGLDLLGAAFIGDLAPGSPDWGAVAAAAAAAANAAASAPAPDLARTVPWTNIPTVDPSTAAASLDEVRAGRGVIKRGMSGPMVQYVQQKVGMPPADIDSDFGSKTEAAVKAFQARNEMTQDGVVTKDVLLTLDSMPYVIKEQAQVSVPVPGRPPAPMIDGYKRPAPPPEKKSGFPWWILLAGGATAGIAWAGWPRGKK
jgi:peptidoglycan hydrolase-like protein with peptidoglycan-binding domain